MRRMRIFLSHWQNWLGLLIVLLFTVVSLTAPLLSPPNETTQGAFKKVGHAGDLRPHPPTEESILGTLPGQIDVYHALIWGVREAMIFGLSVALGAFFFGSLFGSIAGYAGGAVNSLMMRIADAFLTFPALAGVVFIQQMLGLTIESMGGMFWFNNDYFGRVVDFQFTPPPLAVFLLKVDPILISLIIFSWMPIARIVNTMVLTIRQTDFIQAARAMGGSPLWVILQTPASQYHRPGLRAGRPRRGQFRHFAGYHHLHRFGRRISLGHFALAGAQLDHRSRRQYVVCVVGLPAHHTRHYPLWDWLEFDRGRAVRSARPDCHHFQADKEQCR